VIEITKKKIVTSEVIESVSHPGAGAIDVFIGTTRNKTERKSVLKLEFEAYEPMAIKELKKIADRAEEKWEILKYSIVHRVGIVEIGEEAVVIAVATAHRKASFEACEFIIDELKKTVPIWKREVFEDGDVWVAAHP
jgi:molybdopterin synthase catalytic subunit